MKPQSQVTVRSSETGLVFNISRKVAERHDTLTILDGSEPVEQDLCAEVAHRDDTPTSDTAADLSAALVADDKEN